MQETFLWLAALTIATKVYGSNMVIMAECLHLVPPAYPGLRESMQHEHQWLARRLSHGGYMHPASTLFNVHYLATGIASMTLSYHN